MKDNPFNLRRILDAMKPGKPTARAPAGPSNPLELHKQEKRIKDLPTGTRAEKSDGKTLNQNENKLPKNRRNKLADGPPRPTPTADGQGRHARRDHTNVLPTPPRPKDMVPSTGKSTEIDDRRYDPDAPGRTTPSSIAKGIQNAQEGTQNAQNLVHALTHQAKETHAIVKAQEPTPEIGPITGVVLPVALTLAVIGEAAKTAIKKLGRLVEGKEGTADENH